jgi:hypothetical protein
MRELYLVACGVIIGWNIQYWWGRERERLAWDAADKASESLMNRQRFEREHPQPAEPTPA